ncbi:MAG TPA: electron transfer flavoprotein subunit alpha/FixB family protein [Armatimonadetes bacterium]|nr:electron transfer flavoprotein subunit alpha/FixB family protein [Armatimonadota bacterium]
MALEKGVLVFAEQDGGKLAEVALEVVSKGRELADRLEGELASLLMGQDVAPLAEELIAYGCDKVFVADDPRLAQYTTLPYAKVLADLIRAQRPAIVLFGATHVGRDLAPRIASQLRTGLTADCTDLQIGDYVSRRPAREYHNLLLQIRPAFGGNIIATIVCPKTRPQMATVREGVMRLARPNYDRTGEVLSVPVNLDERDLVVRVLRREKAERQVNLKAARIIVAGGAGVGSKENFSLIYELAEVLGGAVGASRAAVDAGFIGKEHQVGQTGTTVRPKLYIACGISGAVQHCAGMAEAGKIVAINTDPHAPIFRLAHYGILGDLKEVIPKIIKVYKEG